MAMAPASALLFGVPPFVNGCWLLIPNVGPDFVGIVGVGYGHIPVWNLSLPEFLTSDTYYFQDFHTDGSAKFALVSTQRLAVPTVK